MQTISSFVLILGWLVQVNHPSSDRSNELRFYCSGTMEIQHQRQNMVYVSGWEKGGYKTFIPTRKPICDGMGEPYWRKRPRDSRMFQEFSRCKGMWGSWDIVHAKSRRWPRLGKTISLMSMWAGGHRNQPGDDERGGNGRVAALENYLALYGTRMLEERNR